MNVNEDWLNDLLVAEWVAGSHVAYLLSTASLFDPAVHTFLADVPALDRVAGPVALAGKGTSGAYATADPVQFVDVDPAGWLIIVADTGVEATSRIVASVDERNSGAPIDTDGAGLTLEFDWPASRLFRI